MREERIALEHHRRSALRGGQAINDRASDDNLSV